MTWRRPTSHQLDLFSFFFVLSFFLLPNPSILPTTTTTTTPQNSHRFPGNGINSAGGSDTNDEQGHGTHVSGTAMGSIHGAAKDAIVHPVKARAPACVGWKGRGGWGAGFEGRPGGGEAPARTRAAVHPSRTDGQTHTHRRRSWPTP